MLEFRKNQCRGLLPYFKPSSVSYFGTSRLDNILNCSLELGGISHRHWRKDIAKYGKGFQIDYRGREVVPRPTCCTEPSLLLLFITL